MSENATELDEESLEVATQALGARLGAEAEEQWAYIHRFSDGKVSLELEWLDLGDLVRAVVCAYLQALGGKPDSATLD